MLTFTQTTYVKKIPKNISCILGADIGGTNSNFGIFASTNEKLKLLLSLRFKSQTITDFTILVQEILEYLKNKYGITIYNSCFAAAGIVSENRDYCKPTNLDFALNAKEILEKTDIKYVTIVNDFEIIGHGIYATFPKSLIKVNEGFPRKHGAIAILGAGTGLGKCIMHWNNTLNRYLPVPSEGGHADFAPQSPIEYELTEYIKITEKKSCNISWEDILSGKGISRIYDFFYEKNGKQGGENIRLHPDKIFSSRTINQNCFDTYTLYTILYARCAKNFALDALALGGVCIAGGIAAKNVELFKQKSFMQEFTNCCKQKKFLANIPIYVVTDYNISLYGAAEFIMLEGLCK